RTVAGLVDEAPPIEARLPPGEGAAIAWLYRNGRVVERETGDDGAVRMAVRLSPKALGQFEQLFPQAVLTGVERSGEI
ncbi:MAG: GTPase HflX, partial [Pseudomonadota bacterium]